MSSVGTVSHMRLSSFTSTKKGEIMHHQIGQIDIQHICLLCVTWSVCVQVMIQHLHMVLLHLVVCPCYNEEHDLLHFYCMLCEVL